MWSFLEDIPPIVWVIVLVFLLGFGCGWHLAGVAKARIAARTEVRIHRIDERAQCHGLLHRHHQDAGSTEEDESAESESEKEPMEAISPFQAVYHVSMIVGVLVALIVVASIVWPYIKSTVSQKSPATATAVQEVVNIGNTALAVSALETAVFEFWRTGDTASVNTLAALRAKAIAWSTSTTTAPTTTSTTTTTGSAA